MAATETLTQRIGHLLKGRYRLDRVLHSGARSTVYAGVDNKAGRVAIKVFEAERDASLLRSSYLANAVGHLCAVDVLDSGSTGDGASFLVMELLEATSMSELMQQHEGRLPVRLACSLADQGLELLACAHAQGIVHGALELRKLVLTRTERLKVLGFGQPGDAQGCAEDVRSLTSAVAWLLAGEPVSTASEIGRTLAPARIAAVLERGLSRNPEQQWKSADAMRTALQLACQVELGRPIDRTLQPLAANRVPRKAPKRARGGMWLAGVGAVLVALLASRQLFEVPEAQATAPEPETAVSAAQAPVAEQAPSEPAEPEAAEPIDTLPESPAPAPHKPAKAKKGAAPHVCAQLRSAQSTRALSHDEAKVWRECAKH